jgi:hypothetical protein
VLLTAPDTAMRAQLGRAAALRWRARPHFLVIGAQKAGTTSLEKFLSAHPRLLPAAKKELHYFYLYYERGLGWYLRHFPWRWEVGKRLCFEATPDYLAHADVTAERMRRDLGPVKLIAVLREPVARAWSAWRMWHSFAQRPDKAAKADGRSFAAAIDAELARGAAGAADHFHYVRMGHYAEHLERFFAHFPADDVLVLDYGEMEADLTGFLQRICAFLEIEPFCEADLARFGGRRHWVSPSRTPTSADEHAMDRLRAHYAPHNDRLWALLGRRFDW